MKDAVSLPWQAVRSAWAVSMTEIKEVQLGWADSTQWSLNHISSSQLAVMNSQNASSVSQKIRICKFLNKGTCSSEGHHRSYKHFCANCYKQGHSLVHPEIGASRIVRLVPRTRRPQYPSRDSVDHSSTPLTPWWGGFCTLLKRQRTIS